MLNSAESIDDVFEWIQTESLLNKRLFISQNEVYPAGFTLGDEDSTGKSLKMEMILLVESDSDAVYYKQEFQDEEQYKEALAKINQLKKNVQFENISEEEMKEKGVRI